MSVNELLNEADRLQQALAQHLILQRRAGKMTRKMYNEAFEATLTAYDLPTPEAVYAELVRQAQQHGFEVGVEATTK